MAVERGCWTTVAASVCAVLGGLLYLNTLNCEFAFDDKAVIIDNNDLRPDVSWLNILRNDFWGTPMSSPDSHKSYRPLTVATFRLNYMLHELQPLGYHLVNVLLHSAVCYLYVLLCGVVFSEVWPALIAGLLFTVHPIHTEAVSLQHAPDHLCMIVSFPCRWLGWLEEQNSSLACSFFSLFTTTLKQSVARKVSIKHSTETQLSVLISVNEVF